MDSYEDVLNHFAELGVDLQAQLGRTVAVSSQAHGSVRLVFVGVSEYEDAGWLLCMREPASTKVEGVHPSRVDF